MGFSRIIPVGTAGQVEINEADMVASVKVSIAESVGGGSVAGVVKAKASAEIDLDAKHLIDLGLDLAVEKFPAAASLIQGAKAAIDAEMAKV